MVDAPDLGSGALKREGSSPLSRTNFKFIFRERSWKSQKAPNSNRSSIFSNFGQHDLISH